MFQKYLPHDFVPPEDAIRLPGFIDGPTTFEDHEFWVTFDLTRNGRRGEAKIYYLHGARWRAATMSFALARAVKTLIEANATQEAFFACYELFRQIDEAQKQTRQTFVEAFVAGRLKKERVRGGTRQSAQYSVFMEQQDGSRLYV